MKYDMKDLTILIPARIESIIRLENLIAVVEFLLNNFNVQIIVKEADKFNNGVLDTMLPKEVTHLFVKDYDPVFYRTKYINEMAQQVTTEYLAVWDTDVIFPIQQVQRALEMLRKDECDIAFPYDGTFLDTSKIIRQIYIETGDLSALDELKEMMSAPYGTKMRGGAFLANTEKYYAAGMENERFYGWGPEDWERVERWKNLGYRLKTVEGVLYHLSHPRDMNGTHNNPEQKKYTFYEKDITKFSSAEEIKACMGLV